MRKMLFTILLLSLFGLLAAQTLLLEDNFTGTVGTLLTANGWSAHNGSGSTPMSIASPGLTYAGYPSSGIGNATSASVNGEDVNKPFTSVSSGSVYYSFLINTGITTTTVGYSAHFMQNSTTFHGRFWLKSVGTEVSFGLSKTTAAATWDPTNYAKDTTHLIVLKYTFNTGSTNDDAVYMFVNPTLGGEEPTPTVSITTDTALDATSISMVGLRQWNVGTLARFDGIRVGTSWADIAGSAAPSPTITVSPSSLSGFTYVFGAGPSAPAQSFTISGANLTNNISIAAPTNFEISETEGSGYTTPIVLVPVSGSVDDKTIYVRLKAGLTTGTYDAELITATSTGALDKTVSCSGSVIAPAYIHAGASELDPLACIQNNPSDEMRSYTLYGENTTSPIVVTAPTGFQIATSEIGDWDSSLELPSSFDGTIYVRMFATSTGEFEGVITHTSGTATQVNVSVSGECFAPSVVWNITQNLTTFTAQAGVVSPVQSYSLSATNATGNLIVSTEAPFELSTTGTGNWLTELSLAYNFSGNVYVRMNASTPGIYTKNINHSSYEASPTSFEISGNATPPAGVYATDLFFSEYIEGGSNNKAVEIFNGTGYPVDLSDYQFENWYNGGSTASLVALSGTLAHGDVYVIANTSASAAIQAIADVLSGNVSFNGDDALVLRKISTGDTLDIFGVVGQDPGAAWTADGGFSTVNKTLVRKPTVVSGITTNPAISTPLVTTDFVTLGTEWLLYAQDTITDLGMHTFNPGGGEMAETPMFDPAGGAYINPINVSITSDTPSASIYYTTNGDIPTDSSTLYTGPIAISSNTTLKAIAYKDGYLPSSVASATYSFPVDVANIAALRASAQGATIYRLTGEAVLTFQQANRNQKYVQDATGAVVIDDPSGIITSTYNLYDGITGITGTLNNYSSLIQFTPVADPGAATSSSNVVVPEVRTLAEITTNDQAKLLKIMNVTLDATSGNFLSTAQNITATDASGTLTMRTFPAADYAATPIPAEPRNIICLGGQFGTTMQFSPRFLSDFEIPSGSLDAPVVTITENAGNVVLDWAAVTGASSYRIEASDDPYTGYSTVTTTANLTWSGAASTAKKFYRVIALP